jgi:hypothetical protein
VHRLKIRDVEGALHDFADSDLNIGFYDDGRLKSINQNTTGEGETIIKSAVSLASAVAPLGAGAGFAQVIEQLNKEAQPKIPCDAITAIGGGKPVSISWVYPRVGTVDLAAPQLPIKLSVAPGSNELYKALQKIIPLPEPKLIIGPPAYVDSGARLVAEPYVSPNEFVYLTLQEMGNVKIEVLDNSGAPISSAVVVTPLKRTYFLPIPRAALFGSQKFSLALSEAGAITAVDYGKNVGTTGALNVASTVATSLHAESPATKANDLKAQADVIAQQQRLLHCQTNPSKCQ